MLLRRHKSEVNRQEVIKEVIKDTEKIEEDKPTKTKSSNKKR